MLELWRLDNHKSVGVYGIFERRSVVMYRFQYLDSENFLVKPFSMILSANLVFFKITDSWSRNLFIVSSIVL